MPKIAKIECLRIDKKYKHDVPLACSDVICDVDGTRISVEVDGLMHHHWTTDQSGIFEAVKEFVADEINAGHSLQDGARLILDEHALKPIARRLNWKPRP